MTKFALFTGLLARNLQMPQSRHAKEIERQNAGAENDFDSDDGLPDMTRVPKPKDKVEDADDSDTDVPKTPTDDKLPEPYSEEVSEKDKIAFQKSKEEEEDCVVDRMTSFFDRPCFSMKVFLSSHFRDKGLVWYVLYKVSLTMAHQFSKEQRKTGVCTTPFGLFHQFLTQEQCAPRANTQVDEVTPNH